MTDVYQRVGFVIAGAAIGAALHKLLQPPPVRSEITVPGQEGALPKRAKSGKVSEVRKLSVRHCGVGMQPCSQ